VTDRDNFLTQPGPPRRSRAPGYSRERTWPPIRGARLAGRQTSRLRWLLPTLVLGLVFGIAVGLRTWASAAVLGPLALLLVGSALWGRDATGAALCVSGFFLAAALSDSFLLPPLTDFSGFVEVVPGKVAPYGLMAVGSILLLTGSRVRVGRERRLVPFVLLGAYLGWGGLALVMGGGSPLGAFRLLQGAIPLATAAILAGQGRGPWAVRAVVAAAFWYVALGVYVWITRDPNVDLSFAGPPRLAAYVHPVFTSFAGAVALAAAVSAVIRARSLALTVLWFFGALSAGFVIWASRGRSGFIAAVVMVVLLSLHQLWSDPKGRARAGILIISLGGVCVLVREALWLWFSRMQPDELLTLTGRTDLWRVAGGLVMERPLTGWGPGLLRAGTIAQEIRQSLGFGGHAHNALFEAALTAGLPGALLWLTALLWVGKTLHQDFWLRAGDPMATLCFALWGGLVVFSVTEGSPAGFGFGWFVLLALAGQACLPRALPAGFRWRERQRGMKRR